MLLPLKLFQLHSSVKCIKLCCFLSFTYEDTFDTFICVVMAYLHRLDCDVGKNACNMDVWGMTGNLNRSHPKEEYISIKDAEPANFSFFMVSEF